MNDSISAYLIAYDMTDDHRRERIAKELLSYGYRVQGSVFIVELPGASFVRLLDALRAILNRNEDSLVICNLGSGDSWQKRYQHYGCHVDVGTFEASVF